jgi:putative flippase GtrA
MKFVETAATGAEPVGALRIRFDRRSCERFARDLGGYFLASAVALTADCGLLLAFHRVLGWNYLVAAGASFSIGIAVAWSLCAAFVFRGRRRLAPRSEMLGFAATGVAGLLLNQCAMAALVGGLGAPPEIAKIPAAGLVFGFNFLSRRRLLFSPDTVSGRSGTGAVAGERLDLALGIVAAAALFLLTHTQCGIIGDARIYVGRALADLDPSGIGQDAMFRLDGQSQFSLFRPAARALVAALSPVPMATLTVAAAQCLWLSALFTLAWHLAGRRCAWIVAIVAVVPARYGAPGVFGFAEPLAAPRPIAEAFVLFAVPAWLAGRRIVAAALLCLAAAFHPIMALAGFGVLGLALLRGHAGWRIAAVLAVAGLAGGAWAGLPVLDRIATLVDADWLGAMRGRNGYLFPDLWPGSTFALGAVQAATLLLTLRRVGPPIGQGSGSCHHRRRDRRRACVAHRGLVADAARAAAAGLALVVAHGSALRSGVWRLPPATRCGHAARARNACSADECLGAGLARRRHGARPGRGRPDPGPGRDRSAPSPVRIHRRSG